MNDTIINILQIAISIILIILIMLQDRSAGLSSAFGGGDNTFHHKRRGFEKTIFNLTIIFLTAFIVLSILNFVL
ncbi:MAG: preprotein translocase subunit SecG [Candidatus Liptonbacteria bacterium CG11_big_fil_rev_8_21_14_0_20_35_14]|uniref:Protein-export membrane protein SecG n=1 Tax=Candidatus Liptonbacteria bacterium CG11_big_fil_rev_8_21_14_0_20_35_14 TaxID=1974634 RepID=A0A2H0N7Z1_9BACT|nr:MAG: preprotein translocase subunit SecG [Candidatus Liptonbacteria bacterium CG11_big_fil_rev_8_21_14_0_20_35_14]